MPEYVVFTVTSMIVKNNSKNIIDTQKSIKIQPTDIPYLCIIKVGSYTVHA